MILYAIIAIEISMRKFEESFMIFAFIFALLVNYFVLSHSLGLGLLLSVLMAIVYYGYYMNKVDKLSKSWYIKVGYLVLLSFTFIFRDMLVFKVLIFLGLPIYFTFLQLDLKNISVEEFIGKSLVVLFRPLASIHELIRDTLNGLFKGRKEAKQIMIGILIALPFLLIVIPLLITSDLVLENMATNVLEGIELSGEWFFRGIFVLFLASYVYTQVSKKILRKVEGANPTAFSDALVNGDHSIVLTTFLIMINLVYGFYVYIQVRYLFLQGGTLPEDLTYAEYAREGFFQLLAVAIINVLLILTVQWLSKKKLMREVVLKNLTLVMTLVMTISSFYRMHLYEDTYGYTSIRLLVFMFLIFMMLFMVLLVSYIATEKRLMIGVIVGFMMVYFMGSAWFNVDGFVATRNIERYEDTGEIDVSYLLTLSADAKDTVVPFLKANPDLEYDTNRVEYAVGGEEKDKDPVDSLWDDEFTWQEWNLQK